MQRRECDRQLFSEQNPGICRSHYISGRKLYSALQLSNVKPDQEALTSVQEEPGREEEGGRTIRIRSKRMRRKKRRRRDGNELSKCPSKDASPSPMF